MQSICVLCCVWSLGISYPPSNMGDFGPEVFSFFLDNLCCQPPFGPALSYALPQADINWLDTGIHAYLYKYKYMYRNILYIRCWHEYFLKVVNKDSDELHTYVHCTVPSVASESLSNAPRSICPLVAPDLVRPSQGPPPPPPPHRDVKHSMRTGRGSGGLWGWRWEPVWRHHSDTRFWGKEKIWVKGKGRHFFRKSSLRRRFLLITRARNRLLGCQG